MNQTTKRIYILRHGQSVDNIKPVYQSSTAELSKKGKVQAREIAKKLTHIKFDLLISSPYKRAKETAEEISKATNKSIEFNNLFIERRKPTSIEGKNIADVEATAIWNKWNEITYQPGNSFLDGETYDELIKRADEALSFLASRDEKSIVVVTHGYFTRTIIARILTGTLINGKILERFQKHASTENTAVSIIERRKDANDIFDWHLVTYNDHSHFE